MSLSLLALMEKCDIFYNLRLHKNAISFEETFCTKTGSMKPQTVSDPRRPYQRKPMVKSENLKIRNIDKGKKYPTNIRSQVLMRN
jgi:hypothetical protein